MDGARDATVTEATVMEGTVMEGMEGMEAMEVKRGFRVSRGRARFGARFGARVGARVGIGVALLAAALSTSACGTTMWAPAAAPTSLTVQEAPLGGEALTQRKQDLERALRDMVALHATMETLIDRRGSGRVSTFDDFVVAYLDQHLDPLLRAEWQSSHPEVVATDANLRFIKVDLLLQMHSRPQAERVIRDIERRYQGRDNMLIGYPVGEQSSVAKALSLLKGGT